MLHIGWHRSRYIPTAMCRSRYIRSGLCVREFGQLFIDHTLCADIVYVSVR